MNRTTTPRRGILILAAAILAAGAIAATSAGATAPLTKAKVKKIATKVVKNLAPGIALDVAAPLAGRVAIASAKPVGTATTSAGTLLTTNISAPASGYLVIHGDGNWANYSGAEDTWGCKIFVDGTEIEARVEQSGPNNEEINCSVDAAVQVGPGAHTVDYRWFNSDGAITFGDRTLIAQYVPFNASGVRP